MPQFKLALNVLRPVSGLREQSSSLMLFLPLTSYRSGLEHLSWYAYKAETRRYLKELNKDKKVSCNGA